MKEGREYDQKKEQCEKRYVWGISVVYSWKWDIGSCADEEAQP